MAKTEVSHPGTILLSKYIKPSGIKINALANRLEVKPRTLFDITLGRKPITAKLAVGLSDCFEVPAKEWLVWQIDYDLYTVEAKLAVPSKGESKGNS
jgi:addiction module HigA family antidote